ncbi:hypothetical protein GGP41_006039 [Bipolaris sorokiniana]|uniref:Rhodopsin domain-containing protein n=1 Tax=Cochliobolus sativus TaxID=45130 RepID=A0A8H5ZH09_COCSA|nr:hypothetical protein GGP41_006039 [Bipolaris sorokiniana]
MDESMHPPRDERQRRFILICVSAVTTALGVSCVALRVYTRKFIIRSMGPEDWTMIVATLFTLVHLSEALVGALQFNMGFRASTMSLKQVGGNIRLIVAMLIGYSAIVTLIKISILLVYRRLAYNKRFEGFCKRTIIVLATYQVIFTIVAAAQCVPLHKLWDFTNTVPGFCININAFYHASSSFHILIDVWILTLPIQLIRRIPRKPREKLALYINLGLGVVSMVASIVRFRFLYIFTTSDDPIYGFVPVNTWSMVEVNVGILCATLPILRPLAIKVKHYSNNSSLNLFRSNSVLSNRIRASSSLSGRGTSRTTVTIGRGDGKSPTMNTGLSTPVTLRPLSPEGVRNILHNEGWRVNSQSPPPVPPKDGVFDWRRSHTPQRPAVVHINYRSPRDIIFEEDDKYFKI